MTLGEGLVVLMSSPAAVLLLELSTSLREDFQCVEDAPRALSLLKAFTIKIKSLLRNYAKYTTKHGK